MRLRIEQRGAKDTRWRDARLTQAVGHFARTLRIPNPKELDIVLKMSGDKKLVNDGVVGMCCRHRNSIYTIIIQRDLPWTPTLEALAHEIVHVNQYATGRLQERRNMRSLIESQWEGGAWMIDKVIPYALRPWEIEALSKEKELVASFFSVEKTVGNYY